MFRYKEWCSECGDYTSRLETDGVCVECFLLGRHLDAAAQKKDQAAFQRQAPKGTWI